MKLPQKQFDQLFSTFSELCNLHIEPPAVCKYNLKYKTSGVGFAVWAL